MEKEKYHIPSIVSEIDEILEDISKVANESSLGSDFSYFISYSRGIFWVCLIRKKTLGNLARKLTIQYDSGISDSIKIRYFVSGELTERILDLNQESWKKDLEILSMFWVSDLSLEKKIETENESW